MKRGIPLDLDSALRLGTVAALFGWNFLEGAFYDHAYPLAMVKLYLVPLWRIAFVALIVIAADWCPSVAIMLAFFIFFYIMDMEVTLEKWSARDLGHKDKKGQP